MKGGKTCKAGSGKAGLKDSKEKLTVSEHIEVRGLQKEERWLMPSAS